MLKSYAWVVVSLVMLFLAFVLPPFRYQLPVRDRRVSLPIVERTMASFRGLFEPIRVTVQSVLGTFLPFAMIVYSVVALFLGAAIDWLTDRLAQRRQRLDQEARAARAVVTT